MMVFNSIFYIYKLGSHSALVLTLPHSHDGRNERAADAADGADSGYGRTDASPGRPC